MERRARILKILSIVVFGIQLTGVTVVSVLYLLNIWNMQALLLPEYFIYIIFGIVIFDTIFILSIIASLYSVRRYSDIKAGNIIGSDIKEVYNFGKIGFVITDEDNNVIWISDFIQSRHSDMMNKDIFVYFPELKSLITKDVGTHTVVHTKDVYYHVKYLRSSNLFVFIDKSDYEGTNFYNKEHHLCIGIITIDNYADVVGTNDDNNDLIARVKNLILEYAKEHHVLLRRIRNDAYFCLCEFIYLREMMENKFDILDKARNLGVEENNQATLSIGFAHEFPDIGKLNAMASNAVDIAMSRGGDQAVVSSFGAELQFFGGKTEAVERRNKVKVRVVADSLITLINRASNVIIMGHTDTDMDAIGASLGIKAICDSYDKSALIVYDPKNAEKKVRTAISGLFTSDQISKMTISSRDAKDKVRAQTLVIVVDVSRPSMVLAEEALQASDKVVVIDHHRRAEEFIENPVLSYIEPSASSASELVAEIIKFSTDNAKIKLDSTTATIMLSGIFLDTSHYKSRTVGLRTFEASGVLKEYGADNALADDLLKDDYEEYALVNKILGTMKTPYYGIVYCKSGEEEAVERSTLAKVGNQCMQLKGISACFVIGKTSNNEIRISARSDGTINVQVLCEKMGGGGHFSMAAVAFKNKSEREVESILLETLDQYLRSARVGEAKKEE